MGRPYGSRTILIICGALAILLGALAAVQYRWSARVAAADAQREKEHLQAAATLFAQEFNTVAAHAVTFLQNDGAAAVKSGSPLTGVPKLLGDLYYDGIAPQGDRKIEKLGPDGLFVPATLPEWAENVPCASVLIDRPPALVTPLYDSATENEHGEKTIRIVRSTRQRSGRCFIASIDQTWLRENLFPQLIGRSFGPSLQNEYDFTVLARGQPIYGKRRQPDLAKPFFSITPGDLGIGMPRLNAGAHAPGQAILVQRVESAVITTHIGGDALSFSPLIGPGSWELQVARKGMPLAAAFEQTRWRNLLLSLAVEALLLAAIVFLVVAARRMERLANQKMQFVAGVSHELRSPVSAIAMLARNQADGLVTGADRVKQYGELMHQQSRRLNEMVEQTLQYAGIHSGRIQPAKTAVDLRRLIEDAVEARRDDLAANGFQVELALNAGLPEVLGDAQWLRTAVDNLLSNAQKHALGGHWIRVSAAYSEAEKEVCIAVEDRGAGIDPADQAEIFEPFSRGRAAIESQIPGSGLGLSLVRSAAEAHRGAVTLVSQPGQGSTFTLHLPV